MSVTAGCSAYGCRSAANRSGKGHLGHATPAIQLHARDVVPARPEGHALLRQGAVLPAARRPLGIGGERSLEAPDGGARMLLPVVIGIGAAAHQELVGVAAAPQVDAHHAPAAGLEDHRLLERQRADLDAAARMQLRHRGAGDLDVGRAGQHGTAGHRMLAQHPQVLRVVDGLEGRAAVGVDAHAQQGMPLARDSGQRRLAVGACGHAAIAPDAPVDGEPVGPARPPARRGRHWPRRSPPAPAGPGTRWSTRTARTLPARPAAATRAAPARRRPWARAPCAWHRASWPRSARPAACRPHGRRRAARPSGPARPPPRAPSRRRR